ncbi:unnamed protein product [Sphagnum troendelagicum]|uniref:MPN domain-containing protein n=1 Tax=Sphagnum troendelagicum TaxID=128251 RepID=A0ABP0V363_9BRYO
MVGSTRYEIAQTAYVKLVLHALKHKTSAVNGVLIGRVSGVGAGDSAGNESGVGNFTVEICNSVPFFHSHLGLLPMLELALTQVDEYFVSQKGGLSIVGYYHANERFDDYELSSVARKIGDHITRSCPQAGIFLLDNRQLGVLSKGATQKPVVQLYVREAVRGWRQLAAGGAQNAELVLKEATANSILSDYISEHREQLVVDFDEHLDDISKDWLNTNLFD